MLQRHVITWSLLLLMSALQLYTARHPVAPATLHADVDAINLRRCQPSGQTAGRHFSQKCARFVVELQRLHTHAVVHGRRQATTVLDHATAAARQLASSPSFPHFIAGITAGVLECVVGHPLDTIRVRIITAGTTAGAHGGTLAQLRLAFAGSGGAMPGVKSLYRGMKSELLSAAVAGSLLFGVNDFFKRWAR